MNGAEDDDDKLLILSQLIDQQQTVLLCSSDKLQQVQDLIQSGTSPAQEPRQIIHA